MELATYILKVTNLEEKIDVLENEVARIDKKLKGLRWIINNRDSLQCDTSPSHHLYYQSDSGTESHAESTRSAASASASFRHKSLR
jgi:hypothetical protein